MKSFAIRVLMFTASAVAMGTLAYGQTQMKADIPFAFQVQKGAMAAGTYKVSVDQGGSGTRMIRFMNTDTRKTALTLPMPAYSPKPIDNPSLVFRCGASGCVLKTVRFPWNAYEYMLPTARGHEHVASIALRSVNSD